MTFISDSRFRLGPVAVLLGATLAGCGRNDIQVYRVSRETAPPEAPAPMAPHSGDAADSASPRLQWKLPAGWEEVAPGEMRVASFRIAGKNAKLADVGIVPLPGLAGSDLANVNRWRGQVGQPPVSEDE